MNMLEQKVRDFVEELGHDPRATVFEVQLDQRPDGVVLVGAATDVAAVESLLSRLAAVRGEAVRDEVVRLPDPELGTEIHALVRASVAPVHASARVSSTQVSQYVMGHRLELLARHGAWWRVRGEDGYIGWVHHGYLRTGDAAWAQAWERGAEGEPMVSLGAELVDDAGRHLVRLPWGARVIRHEPRRFRLPDGRVGELDTGELIEADRLVDWFPPRGESAVRTARRWAGTPYLWGGVTTAGADCSGFVQAVLWMHGVALPRDSDQQARVGAEVEWSESFEELRPGDLLFFSERPERITHVAISLGGSRIIHSALSNGGVAENDLLGGLEIERMLRSILTAVRRVLPD